MDKVTNQQIAVVMKLALEFNAALIGLCTMYYGNMDNGKNQRKFLREYQRLVKKYETDLLAVMVPKKEKDERTNV
jgi:hypothetical protein